MTCLAIHSAVGLLVQRSGRVAFERGSESPGRGGFSAMSRTADGKRKGLSVQWSQAPIALKVCL